MTTTAQTFQFQAESRRLLDLMINSLYTQKEIFLRELISNASDAIDKLRFEILTNPDLIDAQKSPEIRLEVDAAARTLTISDNGIGMSKEEVVENIGTIAKSGTKELRDMINNEGSKHAVDGFIGQFGVGFYSSFMAASKISLITRKAGRSEATLWESAGDGNYTLSDAVKDECGTTITLTLKPQDPGNGLDDFTDKWTLARVVKRYSDFINYPIIYKDSRENIEIDNDGKKESNENAAEDKVLNSMKPLWVKQQGEVNQSEYVEFYKHISHDWNEPLKTLHFRVEGRSEYQALLFIPKSAPPDLFYIGAKVGLRLYAKRVMVAEECKDLLPNYLRFFKGVVDAVDLPLNISRQMLQQDQHLTHIKKWLTKKILDAFQTMFETEFNLYLTFWKQFGRAIKEGVNSDYENRDKIVNLLLFESSSDPTKLITLKEYVARMSDEQDEIFFLTGESRNVIENSPHLEAFREKRFEVLYLVEPVDELLVQSLTEYEGKKLRSVGKGAVTLGKGEEKEQTEKELKRLEEESREMLDLVQRKLDEYVKQVRFTNRLTVSPACLVVADHDYSPQLERLLQKGKNGELKQRRILELNPTHQVIVKLQEYFKINQEDPVISKYSDLLLGYACLAEGAELPNPVRFNSLLSELMAKTITAPTAFGAAN